MEQPTIGQRPPTPTPTPTQTRTTLLLPFQTHEGTAAAAAAAGAGTLATRPPPRHLVLQDRILAGRTGEDAAGAGAACGLAVLAGMGGDADEAAGAPPPPVVLAVAYRAGCVDIAIVPAGVGPRCGAVRCIAGRCGVMRCGAVRCGAVRCGAVGTDGGKRLCVGRSCLRASAHFFFFFTALFSPAGRCRVEEPRSAFLARTRCEGGPRKGSVLVCFCARWCCLRLVSGCLHSGGRAGGRCLLAC